MHCISNNPSMIIKKLFDNSKLSTCTGDLGNLAKRDARYAPIAHAQCVRCNVTGF